MGSEPALDRALTAVARVPRLLVACDYDGTLSPIVANPQDARPLPAAADALSAIAELPATTAVLVSGRARADLARLSGMPGTVQLVGSHGSEFDTGFASAIDAAAATLLAQITAALTAIAAEFPGATIEVKPASVALHVRNAEPADADTALSTARAIAEGRAVHVTAGKAVLEFAVIDTDKGHAVDVLRERHDASAVVYLGDDVTDEKAFRRLRGPDIGVKVGPGETQARYRVDAPEDVAAALSLLLSARRGWLSS